MTENNILIIDIETTDFLDKGGKIVEIGMVALDMETGNRTIIVDEVVYEKGITKEEVENSWIVQNSNLTADMIRHGLRLDAIQPMLQKFIDIHWRGVTAFNNQFDFDFLEDRGFRLGNKLDCPMKLATPLLKLPKSLKAKKAGYGKGYKWPSVQETYDFLFPDNDYTELHRGCDDAWHEAEIVYELYKRGIFKL